MEWLIEYTDEYGDWLDGLTLEQQEDIVASVELLHRKGPNLGFPHSSGIKGSRFSHMRELRTQSGGHPLRSLHAFDPRRAAILLIGGDKTRDDTWYEKYVPIADGLYAEHIQELINEGIIDG
ncbi:MAG: type II toxin-antitoxin system RelE/ParE family toxin [Mailhella sp.]|nr:type II toxin-antitoxin system RelE/ParE family toxin [Mailhella sp.]